MFRLGLRFDILTSFQHLSSSVANRSCQEGKVKEPSRSLPFLPRFFLFFSRFLLIFPDFWQIFRCQGWHSAPLATLVATPLHLRPFSFNIWDLIGYLRPSSAFDTLLTDIWDLIHYLRPFSAFDTLFFQHLRSCSLFEALFSIWDPFPSTFKTLLVIWDPFQHLAPLWRTLIPYSLFETLFSIWDLFHSTFEILFVIWGPFQHLKRFAFNIWDLIGYLRPFSAFGTLWRTRPPIENFTLQKSEIV